MADRPATEEGSEASIQLFLDEEIRIIESEIGSSRGLGSEASGVLLSRSQRREVPRSQCR
ncbi:hypothetical protein LguiB_003177 [Lonicera macranthoides]